MAERDPDLHPGNDPAGDEAALRDQAGVVDRETSRHGPFDSAGGGYGTRSGDASSGGTGDGEPGASPRDEGTSSGGTGATGEGPTEWVRDAPGD